MTYRDVGNPRASGVAEATGRCLGRADTQNVDRLLAEKGFAIGPLGRQQRARAMTVDASKRDIYGPQAREGLRDAAATGVSRVKPRGVGMTRVGYESGPAQVRKLKGHGKPWIRLCCRSHGDGDSGAVS